MAGNTVKLKCPSCGGRSFNLYERLEMAHIFRVDSGKPLPMRRSEGFPLQLGFSAACDCGYAWTPRRSSAMRIMDAEAGRAALSDEVTG